MTAAAVQALRSDADYLRHVLPSLGDDEWEAPSRCSGWTVKDLITHMAAVMQEAVEPGALPPHVDDEGTEARQEQTVAALRHLSTAELTSHYGDMSARLADMLDSLQDVHDVTQLGTLGEYPLHLLANAYAFDHYLHIRADLLAPRGPLRRDPPTTATAEHATAVAEWIVAGFPQMNRQELSALGGTVNLEVPDIDLVVHAAPADDGTIEVTRSPTASDATVTTTADDLALWATKREPWRGRVEIDGDAGLAERFCNALHVV